MENYGYWKDHTDFQKYIREEQNIGEETAILQERQMYGKIVL